MSQPEIRLLGASDVEILREAWHFSDDAPRWFQDAANAWKESFDEFIAKMDNELLFGIFIDSQITAVIRLIQQKAYVYNLHFYAKRKSEFEVLARSALSVKAYLFDHGAKGFYGYIPKFNKSVVKLYQILGFTDSGVRCYKGQTRGKPIEWIRMVSENK